MSLKSLIKSLTDRELKPLDFSSKTAPVVERQRPGLRQGIEFQPGTGHLAGEFTLNVYWSFAWPVGDPRSMDSCRRIGQLCGSGDIWFYSDRERLQPEFDLATRLIMECAIPYLDKYGSIESIISGYEEGMISAAEAFGPDPGWQSFFLRFCCELVGRKEKAIRSYLEVIERWSSDPYDWMRERKEAAEIQIKKLQVG